MPKRKTEDLQKHTLNLRAGDMAKLDAMFQGGASVVIRKLVSRFVDTKLRDMNAETPQIEINIE